MTVKRERAARPRRTHAARYQRAGVHVLINTALGEHLREHEDAENATLFNPRWVRPADRRWRRDMIDEQRAARAAEGDTV